jgi:hypothetical protein
MAGMAAYQYLSLLGKNLVAGQSATTNTPRIFNGVILNLAQLNLLFPPPM